ncbi:adenylate/guanylate cyclase domain-containing protein [Pseudonocardia charpentierae]|uniref:Adenylate/guanylate cyclase domain-containing protein n=1 Tax=Pseudonocardia charpentierae TaxID=3075545 RepID=A0ABU2NE77_9PSEU|nr:adenylate/guanylate cyclase domain-containing protein [Pseudonocardia sp. DSM 45834]MDT0352262.1 adenylate/guanylate cyclase domain-containing protein [Pseudonocardia sp. DSM 45834]
MATRGVPVRFAVWLFHLALPLLGLWLLLAVPSTDLLVEHHPTHFWLVALVAGVNVGLALVVDRAAQRHEDPRLLLVGLGFLAAALFFVLHALATPGVLLDSRNGGFALATPVGLALGALFTAASAVEFSPERAQRVLRIGPWLRSGIYTLAAVWGIFSLAGLPPLRDPAIAERLSGPLIAMTAVSVVLYVFVAVRFYLLYRRRRSVMLLSIITANILLAESMVAVALSVNWRLTWWLWHVLMVLAFGYVAYSAYIGYRREGATTGLFDGVRTEETVRAVRAEYEAALETLVGALRRQEAGEISADEMSLITAGMESRFGLTEGQTAVLGRAADALRTEREQIGRLDTLVAIGHESRVRMAEQDLLQRAVRRVADGFGGDGVRVGLLGGGHLRFPDELATDPSWLVGADVARRVEASVGERGGMEPVTLDPIGSDRAILACPLTVKDKPAGVLLTRRRNGFSERDRSLFASLASQLSMGMENARLYHQLDGLFRVYMSPDVATALLADPEQAALGGAVVEVTALFADLRGFTGFSERSTPEEIVVMLNQYYEHATTAILHEGGTVVQFVGDALMALFNAPARQDDHPVRAARAALAMQAAVEATAAASPGWPRFRVGINTGPALVGNIGSTAFRSFNAMGDAVNVAARLESAAQPGQVVIGESTRAQLPADAAVEPLGELAVKGRRSVVVAYRLFGLERPGG